VQNSKKNKVRSLPKQSSWLRTFESESADSFLGTFICCGETTLGENALKESLEMNDVGEHSDDFDKAMAKKGIFREKHGEGVFLLIQYFLTHLDFIEHGSSVGGAWLTSTGKELLEEIATKPDEI